MAPGTKKKLRIFVGLVVLASAAAYYFVEVRKPDEPEAAYFGNVDVRDVALAFRVAGRVERVAKNEGDTVETGELLAELDKVPYQLALQQARAAFDVAAAELENVEAGARREDISQARAQLSEREAALRRAKDQYERIEGLEARGAATTQSLVDARASLEQAEAAVSASRAALSKLVNGARSEEIKIAHARAQQAKSAVAVAELNLKDTELRASVDGTIVTRAIERGAMVQSGSPALVVAFQDPVWIRAYAEQPALARLSPGTKVRVVSDARPDRPYEGRVGYVSPRAEFTPKNVETEELRTSLVYRFRVIVEKHDGGLRQGMPVTVLPAKGS